MVTASVSDASLRQRAWEVASRVVDPEIPVLTIADLGVLREVTMTDEGVEVAITPTYSGCPAMNMIALEIELALEREGFSRAKIPAGVVPALAPQWNGERRPPQTQGIRHRAADSLKLAPRVVRRAGGGLSAMRLDQYRAAVRIRLDLLQGAVALQVLPRAL